MVAAPGMSDGKEEGIIPGNVNSGGAENLDKSQETICCATDRLCRFSKIRINKPLLFLKISLFTWFSGATAMMTFSPLYFKQLGLSFDRFSTIFVIISFIQFFGPTVSGIVSDKLGRSKPVLQANLILLLVAANCMLFIPPFPSFSCSESVVECSTRTSNSSSVTKLCELHVNGSLEMNCTFHCSSELVINGNNDTCFKKYISECNSLSRVGTLCGYRLDEEIALRSKEDFEIHLQNVGNISCLKYLDNKCHGTCNTLPNSKKNDSNCASYIRGSGHFILSMILLTMLYSGISIIYRIVDFTTMSVVKLHDSNFGRQHVWSTAGSVVFPILAGYIISVASSHSEIERYDLVIYVFDAMVLLTAVTVWLLDIQIASPAKDMMKNTAILLKNKDILAFTFSVLIIGTSYSFKLLFCSWYLEDLGASSVLIGIVYAFGDLLGLPFVFTSNWFVEKLGNTNLILLALVAHSVRCAGYSFLVNPWWAVMYEILEVFTYHVLWVAVVTHSENIAPVGLKSTVIATTGAVHFCLGKTLAGLIGGLSISKYGGRTAYRIIAIMCAVTAVLYTPFLYRRRNDTKETQQQS